MPFWFKETKRWNGPVIIGGTGGSGTRLVHELLEAAGVFMGSNLNVSRDAMDFEPLLDRIINPVLEATHSLNYSPTQLPAGLRKQAQADLRAVADNYRKDMPKGATRWGWKNPRSMYILPLIHSMFPDLMYIHVVRDGRDMAFSPNQHQVTKHFTALFDEDVVSLPQASIRLWAKANLETAVWAQTVLGTYYHYVRFEDLCAYPQAQMAKLFGWLEIEAPPLERIEQIVQRPDSIGRWKEHGTSDKTMLQEIANDALQFFHYDTL